MCSSHLCSQDECWRTVRVWKIDGELIPCKENPLGPPQWLRGKEFTCQCRRHGFYPWVGKMPWKRKWQSTLVFLPGEFHGQRSLLGYSLCGHKESDTTEWAHSQEPHPISFMLCFSYFQLKIFFKFLFGGYISHGIWDLGSRTTDWTHAPCSGSRLLTTGPAGKSCPAFLRIAEVAEYSHPSFLNLPWSSLPEKIP